MRISEVIRDMIRNKFTDINDNVCVFLSGGLDSTIVLHNLVELGVPNIKTFTAKFGGDQDECEKAAKIANLYKTDHEEVVIDNYIETLPEIMKYFSKPRYNVWPHWLCKRAIDKGIETVYIGEGSDEFFGGYSEDRPFLIAWSGQLIYVRFTYDTITDHFGLNLKVPFSDLDWRDMVHFYKPSNKEYLRRAYTGVIPDFIIDQSSSQPPAFASNYRTLWDNDIHKIFPGFEPKTTNEIREKLQLYVTKLWVESHWKK